MVRVTRQTDMTHRDMTSRDITNQDTLGPSRLSHNPMPPDRPAVDGVRRDIFHKEKARLKPGFFDESVVGSV